MTLSVHGVNIGPARPSLNTVTDSVHFARAGPLPLSATAVTVPAARKKRPWTGQRSRHLPASCADDDMSERNELVLAIMTGVVAVCVVIFVVIGLWVIRTPYPPSPSPVPSPTVTR